MIPLPLTEPERIYAENSKYGSAIIMLLPLPSGGFALLGGNKRVLLGAYTPTTFLSQLEVPPVEIKRFEPARRELIPLPDPDLATEFEL